MDREGYETAGVAALICGAGTLAGVVLVLTLDVRGGSIFQPWKASELLFFIALNVVTTVPGFYAALRLRHLLNHQHFFHGVDELIPALICAGAAASFAACGFRALVMVDPALAAGALVLLACLCVLCGALGGVFAMRLLRMDGDLHGYKKPLAYTALAQSLGYALVVTAALGCMIEVAYCVLLALAFFRSCKQPDELDVV
jgi:hypothetical protein